MAFHAQPALGDWSTDAGPIITGHQPRLWHPGILAKYIASDAVMRPLDRPARHVVVDQDTQDALALELPTAAGDRLGAAHVRLGDARPDIPAGCQPPTALSLNAPVGVVADLAPLREAIARSTALLTDSSDPPPPDSAVRPRTLAEQINALLADLMQPYVARPLEPIYATALAVEPWFDGELERLLHDALRCVKHYNDAVRGHPEAGMGLLSVEPYRVEVPLWKLGWMRPRERVYVDLADSRPIFTTSDGEPIDPRAEGLTLAPRALLMTAWLRRPGATPACGTFVHGTGGGLYERVTGDWWFAWCGERLGAMATATADVPLKLNAPLADPDDLADAVWRAHHLPHNLDRALRLDGALAGEKQSLLAHMDDDRDKARRADAFARLHAINDELARGHPQPLAEAQAAVGRARVGLANRAVARRRDWCFALYPAEQLTALRCAIEAAVDGHDSPCGR